MKQFKKRAIVVVHNVRSAYNVGSIFRTADGAGASKIFLTGYTPSPEDEMGRARGDIAKTALGAEKNIPWEKRKNISYVINKLKCGGLYVIALENAKNAENYKSIKIKKGKSFAVIVGNEKTGLSKRILSKADVVAAIPMRGKKESLNVSVAAGVALYSLL